MTRPNGRGTKINFDITEDKGKTQIRFTHEGLNRQTECFDACSNAWSYYLRESLLPLITTGKASLIMMKTRTLNNAGSKTSR
jgi:hypothetical protein